MEKIEKIGKRSRMKKFFITTLLGGLLVILPIVIILWAFNMLIRFIVSNITPVTMIVDKFISVRYLPEIISAIIIVIICFLVGLSVRTKLGNWIHINIEEKILTKIPGYNMVKGAINQLISTEKKTKPFSQVVLFKLFNNEVLLTGVITDDEDEEYVTIFCATAPNPTSGFIYHVLRKDVFLVDISVEDAMRTVFSGGSGSSMLLKRYHDLYGNKRESNSEEDLVNE